MFVRSCCLWGSLRRGGPRIIIASHSLPRSLSRTLEFGLVSHGEWGTRERGQVLRIAPRMGLLGEVLASS